MPAVTFACESQVKSLAISNVLPMRKIAPATRETVKYRRIASSIREVGLIEPLVVHPSGGSPDQFMLLDGHMRLDILSRNGVSTVDCLVAKDDEAFTYNHKVNHLAGIQEHFMIIKALKHGVTEEGIARTLNVDVAKIRAKRDLLNGICPEAVALLRGKRVSADALRQVRKAKPLRQIEMAELMCASNNYTQPYAKCLVAATSADQLEGNDHAKDIEELSTEDMARMEREMESLSKDFREIETTYGKNVLNLVVLAGYLRKLLDSAPVVRYLAQHYPDIMAQLQHVAESRSLREASADPALGDASA
jgi:ParB-like chromosome segregation protein Spo0J